MGLHQEVFLTSRVSHVVRDRSPAAPAPCVRREGRARADAMLQRVPQHHHEHSPHQPHQPHAKYVQITVQKAISLLDKLYDTFFTAQRKAHVRHFTKHFIKIEFLDKACRPVYKEFDEWPEISLEPDPPKEKKEKKESPVNLIALNQSNNIAAGQKMTRKSRPRIKEKEEKEQKGGYCEMCNSDYVDAALHRRSPNHLAFVRDHTNFLALDSLISSGADVTTFLDKATPLNGERRSLRKICNGDVDQPKNKRSKRSQSPDSTVNGNQSPRRNGGIEDERKHNTRCSNKKINESQEDRQYYKVVSTKLRSSGGFQAKRKDSSPTCNGTKPLVVKFRKVRRSELSVLSDEAEQFMFPKRASSTSSSSSDEEEREPVTRRKVMQPSPPPIERRRLARPLALKEESSEEDSWPEDTRRRKRRGPAVARRTRRTPCKPKEPPKDKVEEETPKEPSPTQKPDAEVSPLREEPIERCMKWEDGKLKYTPAVEQLEFAFESVPCSEPWYETFKRQDQDKVLIRNVPQYFALYAKSPKLPYEVGQLPPLKPNCCPLSDLVKREEKPGPSRSYGTRGMKKQKIRKRTAAIMALECHPRKSPREHASTLAILGSAGLLNRRRNIDDAKSTASEDTISDTHSNLKVEPVISEAQEASERLQQFLSEVFEDAAEYDMSEELMEGDAAVTAATNMPDVSSLVSECDGCDIIRNEIKDSVERPRNKRGKFKKKNRTGWPNKRKQKKYSTTSSAEYKEDRSSAESPDDYTTQSTNSDHDMNSSETENDKTIIEKSVDASEENRTLIESNNVSRECTIEVDVDKNKISQITIKLDNKESKITDTEDKKSRSDDDKEAKKKRLLPGLGGWLQPVVRVARVDPGVARRLRSAGRLRTRAR